MRVHDFSDFKLALNLEWGPTFVKRAKRAKKKDKTGKLVNGYTKKLVDFINNDNGYKFTIHGLRIKTYGTIKSPQFCYEWGNVFEARYNRRDLRIALYQIPEGSLERIWPSFLRYPDEQFVRELSRQKEYNLIDKAFWAEQW